MLHKWEITIPCLSPELRRRAYLYLPRAYEEHPDARFPVLYMFDGHNVFLDADAAYGTSWGMYDYMNESGAPLIIAAVECNSVGNGRLREYSPFSHETASLGRIDACGRTLMNWLVHDFKPMLDANLRTLPGREHTLIAGSSMGGLMALYAATSYNRHFQRAACLSPSLWVAPHKVRRMIKHADIAPDTCIYMDYGSQEMGNHEESREALFSTCQALLHRGVDLTFRIVPGGTHSEASWRNQVPIFMKCLGF
ncbi:MAG: alpha/beta hydrolase-fold protein [Clostridia bacterium]|nr:alpha/beta hydrolase-fold protein [Clostridia bacterium]